MKPNGTLILKRSEVASLLSLGECIEAVEEAFRLKEEGQSLPPGVLETLTGDGGFHLKAAGLKLAAKTYYAAKVNANFPQNMSRWGVPTIQGVIALVDELLGRQWSPEQVAGYLRREGRLSISHETLYRHVWRDKQEGGALYTHLRGARKRRRKRYGAYDSRGRLAGKRMISERPPEVEARGRVGHWEADTVTGAGTRDCVVTLVGRKTGLVLIGKLPDRTAESLSRRMIALMRGRGAKFETVTVDNGTEFHDYKRIERLTGAAFYFARPYHSWERGSNENANGLIRQYLPKGVSMAGLSQH